MGVVYRAWQEKLRRQVALKMIPAGQQATPAELSRFRIEAEAVGRLQHSGIVQIYDVGDHAGQPFFTMELVEGGSLAKRLKQGVFAPIQAADLVAQLARAIHHAHQRGIVHRDLNPANVLLHGESDNGKAESLNVKVTDFGLAKLLVGGERTQTAAGDLLGTPSYMAPEQAGGKHQLVGPRTDVYGLGTILYACLTGRPPFRGPTPFDTVQLVLREEPAKPRTLCPDCPADLETICLKCLNKEPHLRYASAEDLANDLERFLRREPISARPATRLERVQLWIRRNPTLAAVVAVATLIVVTIASVGLWQIVEERARFRQERDRAESHLYRSLVSDASAQMTARDTGWWWKVNDAIAQAAQLPNAKHESEALSKLACEFLGSEYPAYRVSRSWQAHGLSVRRLACSPDDQLLATASQDGSVRLWRFADGQLLAELQPPEKTTLVTGLVFIDSQRLAVGSREGFIHVWELKSTGTQSSEFVPRVIQTLNPDVGPVRALLWWKAGERLIVGMQDGAIRIYPLAGAGEPRVLDEHESFISCMAISDTDPRLVSGSGDKTIRVWDLMTDKVIAKHDYGKVPSHLALIGAAGIAAANIEVFGFQYLHARPDGTMSLSVYGQPHSNSLTHLSHEPGYGWMTASADGSVRFWQSYTSAHVQESAVARGEFGPVFSALVTPASRTLVSGYQDGSIRVWERSPAPVTGTISTGAGVVFAGGSRKMFNYGQWIDFEKGLPGSGFYFLGHAGAQGHRNIVWGVAASPNGRWLASGDGDGVVKVWNVHTLRLEHDYSHEGIAWVLAFSHDSRLLASGAGEVKVCDAESGRELLVFELPVRPPLERALVRALAFHPSQPWLAVAFDGAVHICDIATGKRLHALHQFEREVLGLAMDPHGKWLAAALADNRVALWPLESQPPSPAAPQRFLTGHASSVWGVAFRPDGRLLATGSSPGQILLWDTDNFEVLANLRAGRGEVRSLSFSHDGQLLAAGIHLDYGRVWDLRWLRRRLTELGLPDLMPRH
jgi:WD40 repeat protein